ncbi:helix-turn-helix domain-containing protein [Nocardia sp. NPDC048505]|uniref:TetR/AcrR family transcriptional regulator n=1 Tax=unclassified Nocardia TaxID=2637762 RepID=UPI0034111DC3
MNETVDRRVRRTRQLLHRALIELMLERGYDRITVRDILERADVGRSTFYAHFRDKDDLLVVSSAEFLRTALAAAERSAPHREWSPPDSDPLAPLYTIFWLTSEYSDVYRAWLGRKSSGDLLRAYQAVLADLLTERLGDRLELDAAELAATVTFLSWGVVGLLGAIAQQDPPTPPREAYRRLNQLAGPGLRAAGREFSGGATIPAPPPR